MKRTVVATVLSLILSLAMIWVAVYVTGDVGRQKTGSYEREDSKSLLLDSGVEPYRRMMHLNCDDCIILATEREHMYYERNGTVYYAILGGTIDLPVASTSEDFVFLAHRHPRGMYAKDADHVYLNASIIDGAHADSYVHMEGAFPYGLDTFSVFYEDVRIDGANVDTFELAPVSGQGYCTVCAMARDAEALYFKEKRIPLETSERSLLLADIDTLRGAVYVVGDDEVFFFYNFKQYYDGVENSDQVFPAHRALTDADPKTFKLLDSSYAVDLEHVYKDGRLIEAADGATFELLSEGYARDKDNVYYHASIIPDANATQFVVLEDGFGRDKDRVFHGVKEFPGIDPDNFDVLERLYVRDNKQIYAREISFVNRDYGDGSPEHVNLTKLDANVQTFRVLKRIPDNKDRDDEGFSLFATDGSLVWLDARVYAAYERNGENLDVVDEAKDRIVVRVDSVFADSLIRLPGSNHFLYDNTVWYARPLMETSYNYHDTKIHDSKRGTVRYTFTDYFVLEKLESYVSLDQVEYYRCDYVRVGDHVFSEARVLHNADPASYRVLGDTQCQYSVDNSRVYFFNQEMTDADAETFQLDDEFPGWAFDSRYSYDGYFRRNAR